MNRTYRLGLVTLVVGVTVAFDQAVKSLARASLALHPPIVLLGGIVRLEFAENAGALLSLGATLPEQVRFLIFVVFVSLTLLVTVVLAFRSQTIERFQLLALALITGGGLGNLIDRFLNDGQVVDFVSLGVGPVRTGIFNVADLAIVAGIAIMALSAFQPRPEPMTTAVEEKQNDRVD